MVKSFLKNSNTITSDISSFIKDIGKMQTLMNKIQTNDINRNGIIKKYKSFMDSATKFAAAEMNIDEKGNISMDYTKVSELQEQTANKLHSTVVEKTEGQTKNASCTITIKEMDKER
jgi:hypothetical protein